MTPSTATPELILRNGRFTTLDRANPTASAVAIAQGRFTKVGDDREVMALAGPQTRVIDLGGRAVLPGLIDNHLHIIRGGLNFNMELRWDGVKSLADAMAMLKRQVDVTPAPQWVRVVGGFTEHQFVEKRLPTLAELNAVAPDCGRWATAATRPRRPVAKSCATAPATPLACCWPSPMRPFCTPRWPRARSCRTNTR